MGLFSKEEPVPVLFKSGKELACLVCGGNRFYIREALMNTAANTFLNLDWADSSAHCKVCGDCGYVHWFLSKS